MITVVILGSFLRRSQQAAWKIKNFNVRTLIGKGTCSCRNPEWEVQGILMKWRSTCDSVQYRTLFKFSSPQKLTGNFGNLHKWIYASAKQDYFGWAHLLIWGEKSTFQNKQLVKHKNTPDTSCLIKLFKGESDQNPGKSSTFGAGCGRWCCILRKDTAAQVCYKWSLFYIEMWVGDFTLVLKAAKTPSLTELFLFYTLSPLGWSRSPSRYHCGEVSAFPSPLAQPSDPSHTSLTPPTKVPYGPWKVYFYFSLSINQAPSCIMLNCCTVCTPYLFKIALPGQST